MEKLCYGNTEKLNLLQRNEIPNFCDSCFLFTFSSLFDHKVLFRIGKFNVNKLKVVNQESHTFNHITVGYHQSDVPACPYVPVSDLIYCVQECILLG